MNNLDDSPPRKHIINAPAKSRSPFREVSAVEYYYDEYLAWLTEHAQWTESRGVTF